MSRVEEVRSPNLARFNNLDLHRYLDLANYASIKQDLLSLLLEMDVMSELVGGATVRQMFFVPGEGFYHSIDGQLVKYSDFFAKAIAETRDMETANRFEAEGLGWERAEKLFEDEKIGSVIVASPPGETYKFEDMKPLSATFILNRMGRGELEIGGEKKVGFLFDAFAIYVDEIAPQTHVDYLSTVAELAVRDFDPSDPLSIVAAPFILEKTISALNELVRQFGFESFEQVEANALDLQTLYQDGEGKRSERRELIIELLKQAIDQTLERSTEHNRVIVAESIKRVLAKEAMGRYVGKTIEVIRRDVLLTIASNHHEMGYESNLSQMVDPLTYSVWKIEQGELEHNVTFRRMMVAHGGGGLMTKEQAKMEMSLVDLIAVNASEDRKRAKCSKCHSTLESNGKCSQCRK